MGQRREPDLQTLSDYRIVQNGSRVLILMDGTLQADVPWQEAKRFAQNVAAVAKLANEWEEAERVAMDAAILLRAGANIGLANHHAILKEAVSLAVNDRDLRRFMPGIRSTEVFGAPTIRNSRNGLPS